MNEKNKTKKPMNSMSRGFTIKSCQIGRRHQWQQQRQQYQLSLNCQTTNDNWHEKTVMWLMTINTTTKSESKLLTYLSLSNRHKLNCTPPTGRSSSSFTMQSLARINGNQRLSARLSCNNSGNGTNTQNGYDSIWYLCAIPQSTHTTQHNQAI